MSPYLKKSIDLGPIAVERLLAQIDASRFDEAKDAERFTVREVVAHLADWEPLLRARIEHIIREPGCTVQVFDEGHMAVEHRYSAQSVDEALASWKDERAKTSRVIKSLTDADLDIPFVHPDFGPMRLRDMADMLPQHDLYHVEQLTEYL